MYSTKTAITMSLRDLLEKVNDYDIYAYYLGSFKPGKLMNSPLRPDDKIPSFAIFPSKTGDLLFKDHGTGESGNAIKFMKLYKGISERKVVSIVINSLVILLVAIYPAVSDALYAIDYSFALILILGIVYSIIPAAYFFLSKIISK
jgi:hypothetical protein